MNKVIQQYAKHPGAELEIKLAFDPRVKGCTVDRTEQIKRLLLNDGNISQTINLIQDNSRSSMFIKQLQYENGKKINTNIYEKKSLMKPVIFEHELPCKITLSQETPVEREIMLNLARFKYRKSIEMGEWRLDITLVKTIKSSNIELLKATRDSLFGQDILKIDFNDVDQVEVELEYVGDNFTIKSLRILNQFTEISQKSLELKVAAALKTKPRDLKRMLNNPIELTKQSHIKSLKHIKQFYITDKIDGLRTVIIIQDCVMHILHKDSFEVHPVFTDENVILDTEMLDGKYYVFDIISSKEDIFADRLDRIKLLVDELHDSGLRYKEFRKLESRGGIKEFYEEKKQYAVDGLIFVQNDASYIKTKNYKWKATTTIDFLAKKCPVKLLGINPYVAKPNKTLYILFCGMTKRDYLASNFKLIRNYNDIFKGVCTRHNKVIKNFLPVQFSPSIKPNAHICWLDDADLDDCVIEVSYNNEWVLERVRPDKKQGNYYKTAESLFMNFINKMSIDELSQNEHGGYFKEDNSTMTGVRAFNNYVKKQLLKTIHNKNSVIDLAAGRGQDLPKYIYENVKYIWMLDSDANAIAELSSRQHYYTAKCAKEKRQMPEIKLKICDLNQRYKDTIADIQTKFNLVVCNFAIHYLTRTKKEIMNICGLISKLLERNGTLLITAFDAANVNALLGESNEWVKEPYAIKKMGKKIGVKLPFSNGEFYEEHLVNIGYITEVLAKKKIKLIATDSFDVYLPSYKKNMDEADREFASLYSFYIFKLS